jgi:hypothetical protein
MASRSLGSLTLDLILKYGGFEQGMDRAARTADKRMKEIEARAKKFGSVLGGAIAAGAGIATAAIVGLTKQAIDAADRMNDISQRLGVGTEALSAWGYAAQQSGTDLEALNTSLTRFTKNVAAAMDADSRQGKLFESLGVSVRDASGNLRRVEDLLPEVADKFKELNNATLEAALAQELFGRSGSEILQFLNLGADGLSDMAGKARDLGVIVSQDVASAADEFNDQLNDLKSLAAGAGLQLAKELLPTMIDLVTQFREGTKEGGDVGGIIKWIGEQAKAAVVDLKYLYESLKLFGDLFKGLSESALGYYDILNAIARLDFSDAAKGLERMRAGGDLVRDAASRDLSAQVGDGLPSPEQGIDFSLGAPMTPQERSALERRLNGFMSNPTGKTAKKSGKSDAEREAEQLKAAYERMNESLAEQIALFGKDGEAARVRYEIEHGALRNLTAAQKDGLIAQAERLDMMRDEAEVQKKLDQENKRREEAVEDVLDSIRTERDLLGQTIEFQDTYNKLKWAGVDANSAYGQSIIQANQALHEQIRATQDQVSFMDGLRDSAKGFFRDLKDGVGVWDSLKNAADRFADTIFEIVSSRLIEQMFGQMGTTGGGSAGGFWAGLASAFFGGGRASGGPVNAGMFYRVNENGPELLSVSGRDYLMMGSQSGKVIPHGRGMGGGATINQTFVVSGTPDNRTREQMARMSGREAARGLSRTGR